jgi:hypothetical protein
MIIVMMNNFWMSMLEVNLMIICYVFGLID